MTTPTSPGAVEVCFDCDIADCHHIRARRAAMNTNTPGAPDVLQGLHNELYRAQTTDSVEVLMQAIGKARILLARYRDSPAAAPAPATQLLSEYEQRAVLADPMGLECLINYHDCQDAGADAVEPDSGRGNARRALELLKLGREIIAADPDLWHEEQKKPFALRYSERATLGVAEKGGA